ncbi:putative serine protease F56F10.1 [Anoplophora glabripennis]|uniref:putative serine protease F56F10.1 n=1 Tax=Anoplophora glabripennis TaxID=217634 RepID=UPI000C77DAD3|nr:putative serine protease F56F10.1 [Anoplophora glabripennis]
MKFSVTVLILFSVNHALSDQFLLRWDLLGYDIPPPEVTEWRAGVITGYFSQRLDHFDPSNTRIWLQRYFVSDKYFDAEKRDVIFLMISGEGQASEDWLKGGSWIKSAKKYGALLFVLEHRFYGVSQPFRDLRTENLRFLSSRQALQDAAVFINGINQKYNLDKDAMWIAFGGSYAGALVAWLRLKYPHLVQGAVSASGPIHAQLDFHGMSTV